MLSKYELNVIPDVAPAYSVKLGKVKGQLTSWLLVLSSWVIKKLTSD